MRAEEREFIVLEEQTFQQREKSQDKVGKPQGPVTGRQQIQHWRPGSPECVQGMVSCLIALKSGACRGGMDTRLEPGLTAP